MTNPASPDLGRMYRHARERVAALVNGDIDVDRLVPATPEWRVRDVVAHLSGIADDVANGNMAGAPGDEWTAAQVARGRGRAVAELIADWTKYSPTLEGILSGPAGDVAANAVVDAYAHEADVRHALGLPLDTDREFLAWAAGRLRDLFAASVLEAGLPPVALALTDAEWFRARLGRRSESQVRAYDWPVDPTPYLDTFFIFGRADQPLAEVQ
ncbi:MAG: maleylpyruvate isomerase family mycothiol-dependent enzyme [Actinobacteria bacterium]|nr:maleylpyruvate isomerase family mycothiol-dependent enzyme [Actinomycetota bacterium]